MPAATGPSIHASTSRKKWLVIGLASVAAIGLILVVTLAGGEPDMDDEDYVPPPKGAASTLALAKASFAALAQGDWEAAFEFANEQSPHVRSSCPDHQEYKRTQNKWKREAFRLRGMELSVESVSRRGGDATYSLFAGPELAGCEFLQRDLPVAHFDVTLSGGGTAEMGAVASGEQWYLVGIKVDRKLSKKREREIAIKVEQWARKTELDRIDRDPVGQLMDLLKKCGDCADDDKPCGAKLGKELGRHVEKYKNTQASLNEKRLARLIRACSEVPGFTEAFKAELDLEDGADE